MTAFVASFLVLLALAAAFFVAAKLWSPKLTLGGPTPDEARVQVETAEKEAKTVADVVVKEIKDEGIDANIDRARNAVRRGKQLRDDK